MNEIVLPEPARFLCAWIMDPADLERTYCHAPATHAVAFVKPGQLNHVSYVCDKHATAEALDGEPPYILSRLPDNYEGGPIDVRQMVRAVGVDAGNW